MNSKISMLSTLPPIKGISPYTMGLVNEMSKNCEIIFFGFKKIYPEFLYPGKSMTGEKVVNLKNVNLINNLTWYNPFSWIKIGFKIQTQIIHAQWWSWALAPIYLTILKIARWRNKKIILTIHNIKPHEKSFFKNWINRSVLELADVYIVHNEKNRKILSNYLKKEKKVFVVPHGIIKIEKSRIPIRELREKYRFNHEDKILLFFGSIRDYKGLDILLRVMKTIKNSNIKLIIAGKPWSSFEKYNTLINNLGLKKKVFLFLNYLTEQKIAELFKISDLLVLPYKQFEASSGVGTLALNFEKPLVVTDVGGLTDLVNNPQVIAKSNNPEDLMIKIEYALKNLPNLKKISVEKKLEFSWKNISKKTLDIYQNIIDFKS